MIVNVDDGNIPAIWRQCGIGGGARFSASYVMSSSQSALVPFLKKRTPQQRCAIGGVYLHIRIRMVLALNGGIEVTIASAGQPSVETETAGIVANQSGWIYVGANKVRSVCPGEECAVEGGSPKIVTEDLVVGRDEATIHHVERRIGANRAR